MSEHSSRDSEEFTEDKRLLLANDEQHDETATTAPPTEYRASSQLKFLFLFFYMSLNLGLTLYTKAVLSFFPYPWLLTALHAAFAAAGSGIVMLMLGIKTTKLSRGSNLTLMAFSSLFTVNIAVSNISLAMVSVPFHQTLRASCPIFTVCIYRLVYGRTYSTPTLLSLVPIMLGVTLATYGDYDYTIAGLVLTVLGVLLAAIKTIATNRIMTGPLALPAIEVLFRMAPLASLQSLVMAYLSNETTALASGVQGSGMPKHLVLIVCGNGLAALLLNLSSFQTNKLAGALTLTVCANVKQCLTILIGIMIFNVKVSVLNGFGMAVTAIGAACFSMVEVRSKTVKETKPVNIDEESKVGLPK